MEFRDKFHLLTRMAPASPWRRTTLLQVTNAEILPNGAAVARATISLHGECYIVLPRRASKAVEKISPLAMCQTWYVSTGQMNATLDCSSSWRLINTHVLIMILYISDPRRCGCLQDLGRYPPGNVLPVSLGKSGPLPKCRMLPYGKPYKALFDYSTYGRGQPSLAAYCHLHSYLRVHNSH
jgi:hypothetical protein